MNAKLKTIELAWFLLIFCIFIFLSFSFVGTELRNGDYDCETDITLMRFLNGDPWSLLVTNRSPVLEYSIPYGGWPPLQTLIQASWLPLNIPIEYARLLTGMLIIFSFGIFGVFVGMRVFPQADKILIFMLSLLSPVVLLNMSISARHIFIPLASIVSLYSLSYYSSIEKNNILFFSIGFFLGLTDWNAYSILPAVIFYLLLSILFPSLIKDIDRNKLFKWFILTALGFTTAFILYKMVTLYVIQYTQNKLFIIPGITFGKLVARTISNPLNYFYAIFLFFIRLFLVFIPIIFLMLFLKITNWGRLTKNYSNQPMVRLIVIISFLGPGLYYLIFPGHAGTPSAIYQALVFITPGLIVICHFNIADNKLNMVRSFFIVILVFLCIFSLRGQVILPDYLVEYSSYHQYVAPLKPGNYDFSPRKTELTGKSLLRLMAKQITSLPISHDKLTKINTFNRSAKIFQLYGEEIGRVVNNDEIILFFGTASWNYTCYCKRILIGVDSIERMKLTLSEINKSVPGAKWVLLAPNNSLSDIEKSYLGNYPVTSVAIGNSSLKIYRFNIN